MKNESVPRICLVSSDAPAKYNILSMVCFILYYVCNNALFCHEQFGFRNGHSTELATLYLTNYLIKQMDQGGTFKNRYTMQIYK